MDTESVRPGDQGLSEIKALIMGVDKKLDAMDGNMNGKLKQLESNMEDRFNEVTEDIDDLCERVARNKAGLEDKMQSVLNKQSGDLGSAQGSSYDDHMHRALTLKLTTSRAFLHAGDKGHPRHPALGATGPA